MRTLPIVALAPLALALISGCSKKKDEEPPPVPTASAPAPPPTPTPPPAPVEIQPEQQAAVEDAGPDVVKKAAGKGAPSDVAGLRACCTALRQNAASMPPPNNAYAISAAQVCDGLVTQMASGSVSKAGAVGMIGATLKGAGLPPACR